MKSIYSILVSLLVMAATAGAQTISVPNLISYQGRVVDAGGIPVGDDTPVNRTVIFRIWDHPSNVLTANLIYSESQVVTVSNGEFSALVGQGVPNVIQTFNFSEVTPVTKKLDDLSTAFSGPNRYLGVTVATGATLLKGDKEITPRQQIVATPFAMRAEVAKFAESINTSSDLTLNPLTGTASNYGLGWYGTGRPFSNLPIDGPVLYGKAGGALGSNVSGAQKTALRWDATGRVGIGATSITSPTNKLTLQGDIGTTPADQFTIRGNANNNERLLLGYDTSANKASLQSYTGASTKGPLLLNPSGGNVGINKTSPGVALDVTGSIAASAGITANAGMAANGNNGYRFTTGDLDGGLFSPSDGVVTIKTNGIERLRIDSSFPTPKITTSSSITTTETISAGQISTQGRLTTKSVEYWGALPSFGALFQSGLDMYATNTSATDGDMVLLGKPRLHLATANGGAAVMTLLGNNVGIGTTTPTEAKLVVNGAGAPHEVGAHSAFRFNGANYAYLPSYSVSDVSIKASDSIHAASYRAFSDARIKVIEGQSDGEKDLEILSKIEITDYTHKDVLEKGNDQHKKVIAQQVEKVFPQAVGKTVDVVPDIYKPAKIKDGWVALATDLKVGERLRLITGDHDAIHEVLEIDSDRFRTDFRPELKVVDTKPGEERPVLDKPAKVAEKVFVFGREVKDFRVVDYEAIAMLNVSATQELARELKLVKDENAALRRELAAKTETFEARLIALEQHLSNDAALQSVSLKAVNVVK
jgi:hypothetical protein